MEATTVVPSDAIFVKRWRIEDNLADLINYCNRMRPQQINGGVPTFVRVFIYEPDAVMIKYLKNSHKIHFLGTLDPQNETEKIVILANVDAKRFEYFKPEDRFFTCHSKCLFVLDPWESVDLSKEVEKLKRELQEIKDAILYAPGGPIYQESKAHFESTTALSQQEKQDPSASYPLPKKHKHQ